MTVVSEVAKFEQDLLHNVCNSWMHHDHGSCSGVARRYQKTVAVPLFHQALSPSQSPRPLDADQSPLSIANLPGRLVLSDLPQGHARRSVHSIYRSVKAASLQRPIASSNLGLLHHNRSSANIELQENH